MQAILARRCMDSFQTGRIRMRAGHRCGGYWLAWHVNGLAGLQIANVNTAKIHSQMIITIIKGWEDVRVNTHWLDVVNSWSRLKPA
jgi:hypothetical protein